MFVIFILGLFSISARSCEEKDFDYYGNNIKSIDTNVPSWQVCSDRCRAVPSCTVWTYSPSKHCHLKNSMKGRRKSEGNISGKRSCGNEKWASVPRTAIYQKSYEWKLIEERQTNSTITEAKQYASLKDYHHFLYCHDAVDFGKRGLVAAKMTLFLKRYNRNTWLGKAHQCDWYSHREPFPINGGWSLWSSFTDCFKLAGELEGTQARRRLCINPKPAYGGHFCNGSSIEEIRCRKGLIVKGNCDVPKYSAAPNLTEAIKQMKIIVAYIENVLPPMENRIKKLHREIIETEARANNISQVKRDFRQTKNNLSVSLVGIQDQINRGIGDEKLRKDEKSTIIKDIDKFTKFHAKLIKIIAQKERERNRLIEKKTQLKTIATQIKTRLLKYKLSTNDDTLDFLGAPDIAKEETGILNQMMKEGISKLRYVSCY